MINISELKVGDKVVMRDLNGDDEYIQMTVRHVNNIYDVVVLNDDIKFFPSRNGDIKGLWKIQEGDEFKRYPKTFDLEDINNALMQAFEMGRQNAIQGDPVQSAFIEFKRNFLTGS